MLKKITLISCLTVLTATALADTAPTYAGDDGISGYYVGLSAGYALNHFSSDNSFFGNNNLWQAHNQHDGGFTGRLSGGYNFNEYFGVEVAYDYLPSSKATLSNGHGSSSVSSYDLDAMLVGRVPFVNNFDFFVKAGMAYISSEIDSTDYAKSYAQIYRPAFAIGWDYRINTSFMVNVQWLHTLGDGNAYNGGAQQGQVTNGGSFTKIPPFDTFTGGVVYRF
tara:strand:+ start:24892 stop:25557 length:666 start_codon:yes stop_codon:yes gene_type:complete